jgi:lipoprotein-anchoring transpeptidase ErfK/SrfK
MKQRAFWLAIAATSLFVTAAALPASAGQDRLSNLQNGSNFGRNEKSFVRNPRFARRTVQYGTPEAPGTIIIETDQRSLYYVLSGGKALRYKIAVGREGFTWSGTEQISRMATWPAWHAPKDMLARRPDIPDFVEGGPKSPLGARAMYLGSTDYRIHGTPAPWTIGFADSSGCIRMTNEDVTDLYGRVTIGTKVIVR